MAEVLTLLDRGAEAISFRLNAAKCFKRAGKLAEAATSCDLLLELEADHEEALMMRVDLPVEGAPPEAQQPPDLPDEETIEEVVDPGVVEGKFRSQTTVEVMDTDVLETNTVLEGEDDGLEGDLREFPSVEIDLDRDTMPPEDEEVASPEKDGDEAQQSKGLEAAETEIVDQSEHLPTTRHDAVEDERPTTRHDAVEEELPTKRHDAVMTPLGWGPPDGEEEVIELRDLARKSDRAGDEGLGAKQPIVPVSQPLAMPEEFRARGEEQTYETGEIVIRERDRSTDLWLLTSGKLEVLKETWFQHEGRNRFQRLALLEAESCVGELSLLGDGHRHATVRAIEPCTLLRFDKSQIKTMMREDAGFNRSLRRLYRQRLQDTLVKFSSLFQNMPGEMASAFLKRCKPRRLGPDKVVVKAGTLSSGVNVVLLGMLDVTSSGESGEQDSILLHRFHDGDVFGGISHILKQLSPGTVRTRTFVQLLHITPPDFDELTREHPGIIDLMRPEADRRKRSYHSIIEGEAQYEVGTAVFLLEKKKDSRDDLPPLQPFGLPDED